MWKCIRLKASTLQSSEFLKLLLEDKNLNKVQRETSNNNQVNSFFLKGNFDEHQYLTVYNCECKYV